MKTRYYIVSIVVMMVLGLPSDLGVAVEKVELLNENEEVIKQLSRFAASEKVYFEMNNKNLKSPMNLKFTFTPLQEVVLDLNEEFAIKAYK